MAEAAVGAIVAEQVVSTGIEAGAVAALARPTLPLKATLHRIPAPSPETKQSLARSHHTVSVIEDSAYIFGGKTADGQTCSTDIHRIALPVGSDEDGTYSCIPAAANNPVGTGSLPLPVARHGHAACTRRNFIVVHGGKNDGGLIEEDSCLWLWNSENRQWSTLRSADVSEERPASRYDHQIFVDEKRDILILHGGYTSHDSQSSETWLFNFGNASWRKLSAAPAMPSGAVLGGSTLYSLSGATNMSGSVHSLKLDDKTLSTQEELTWETVEYPAGPLTPGPQPREGSSFVSLNTGYGRHYLVRLLGYGQKKTETSDKDPEKSTGIWTLVSVVIKEASCKSRQIATP